MCVCVFLQKVQVFFRIDSFLLQQRQFFAWNIKNSCTSEVNYYQRCWMIFSLFFLQSMKIRSCLNWGVGTNVLSSPSLPPFYAHKLAISPVYQSPLHLHPYKKIWVVFPLGSLSQRSYQEPSIKTPFQRALSLLEIFHSFPFAVSSGLLTDFLSWLKVDGLKINFCLCSQWPDTPLCIALKHQS